MQVPKNAITEPWLGELSPYIGGFIACMTNRFEDFLIKNQDSCIKTENKCLELGWHRVGLLLCIARRLVAMGTSNLIRERVAKMVDRAAHTEDNRALYSSRLASLVLGIYRHARKHKNGYSTGLIAGCQEYLERCNNHSPASAETRRLL
jgi:hypothetical protein